MPKTMIDRPNRPVRNSNRPTGGREAGWTLLEMMVVCGLFSILGAIAVPQYSALAMQMRVSSASTQILSDLSWAREMSMRTGVPHYVEVDSTRTGVNYRVKRTAVSGVVQSGSDPVVRSALLGNRLAGVSFALNGATADPYGGTVSSATPGRVVFDPRGLPSSSGAFFVASDDGRVSKAISVTGAGRVRVWTRSGGGWK